jgi:hypothetical protein
MRQLADFLRKEQAAVHFTAMQWAVTTQTAFLYLQPFVS